MDLLIGAGLFRVGDAHAAVDAATFDDGECARVDVADDDGGSLHFDPIRCVDGALHAAADHRLARVDVAEYFALSADEYLSCGADAAFDATLDLHDAIGVDV